MWYVMNAGAIIGEPYVAKTLGEAMKLGRLYKAIKEANMPNCKRFAPVTVCKCGGAPMQCCIDGTQVHYID